MSPKYRTVEWEKHFNAKEHHLKNTILFWLWVFCREIWYLLPRVWDHLPRDQFFECNFLVLILIPRLPNLITISAHRVALIDIYFVEVWFKAKEL